MNEALQWRQPADVELGRHDEPKARVAWLVLVLGMYWLQVFNQLRVDWTINPQYYYGWMVPLLALGSFHLRWLSRPPAAPPGARVGLLWLAGAAAAGLLPIRLIEEANPEWRLVLWAHTLQMVLISLCVLYYAGGWPWVKHCAFPVAFILVAVPWPVPVEQSIIQGLMRGIAAVTVEMAGLLNIPAMQYGNVIQISSGLVGIDEACSGVRSLQTTLFVSLFLGELYRFSARRRVGLTLASFGLALAGNVGRTTFLVWCAARKGLGRMHDLHDNAGLVALVGTLLGLWGLAQWLRQDRGRRPVDVRSVSGGRNLPRALLCSLAVWFVVVEAATEGWYQVHELRTVENARWSINWPVGASLFGEVPISDTVRSILRYSTGRAVAWEDSAANRWQLFLFRWEPGRNSAQLATTHTPDICLQAAGYQLKDELETRLITVQGLNLPIRQSVFMLGGETLHVFYCLWEDHPAHDTAAAVPKGIQDISSRLRAVRAGRRHLGQQVLEVAIQGPATAEQAAAVFESQLGQLILRDAKSPLKNSPDGGTGPA
jgi:exosortase